MSSISNQTIVHETIRLWIDDRGGEPATVKSTGGGEDAGILRDWFLG